MLVGVLAVMDILARARRLPRRLRTSAKMLHGVGEGKALGRKQEQRASEGDQSGIAAKHAAILT